ncbi:hypothetical protein PBY51_010951 [Eleginops maclovinus]|uniref:Uncharacterized protein n=1 Tax=Eleginops maclovinus TaxID=56733 RepID=A0AAN7XDM8_ELEMC|nr:hypothetical protein PBY51_010951 [Eleginops maclovinus]
MREMCYVIMYDQIKLSGLVSVCDPPLSEISQTTADSPESQSQETEHLTEPSWSKSSNPGNLWPLRERGPPPRMKEA